MAKRAPGKHYRKGMSLSEAVSLFNDPEKVEQLFIQTRWPNGVACTQCGSLDVQVRQTRKPALFRCRDCRLDFSVKTGTVMQGSNLSLGKWALAIYLMTTGLKGTSSMKLHRDLGITQKAAWHLQHRIRRAWETKRGLFGGPVEVDETYIGGKQHGLGRGPKGKASVVGVKDQVTKQVVARPVKRTDKQTLQGFIKQHVHPGAIVYTDAYRSYASLPFLHKSVRHHLGEYVRGQATTNGIESFWAMLKRGYHGTYHKMSVKHLRRYVTEFAGRHNDRELDTYDQVRGIIRRMEGKRLRYQDLVA